MSNGTLLRFSFVFLCSATALAACGSSTTSQGSALGRGGASGADAGQDARSATGTVDPGAHTISYARDVQPIWDAHCIECHVERLPVLTAGKSYEALTTGHSAAKCSPGGQLAYVVPGEPDQSFLFFKLTGEAGITVTDTACKRLMPATPNGGGTPLAKIDAEAIKTISTWIAEGATAE